MENMDELICNQEVISSFIMGYIIVVTVFGIFPLETKGFKDYISIVSLSVGIFVILAITGGLLILSIHFLSGLIETIFCN